MTIKFKGPGLTHHEQHRFPPKVPFRFEDPDAEPYFLAAGWAEETDEEPIHTYTQGEVDVDPMTTLPTGGYVLPDLAQARLDAHDGSPPPPKHELAFKASLIQPEAEGAA
jgi:hypothetical protein